jgi:hypothetical protein
MLEVKHFYGSDSEGYGYKFNYMLKGSSIVLYITVPSPFRASLRFYQACPFVVAGRMYNLLYVAY